MLIRVYLLRQFIINFKNVRKWKRQGGILQDWFL